MATVAPASEPDLYGQRHPHETKELIAEKLIEFERELDKIPDEKKVAASLASEKCPDLVNDDFKLKFLRCEVFNADLAAKRYAYYWKKRLSTFGEEKAFLPMTQEGALVDDRVALELLFVSVLGKDPTGRSILFFDGARLSKSKFSRESACRAVWYFIHAALEDVETQQKGVVMLGTAKGCSYYNIDLEFAKFCCTSVKGCLPLRISGIHLVHPPTFLRLIFPICKMLLGERISKRVHIHSGSEENYKAKLEKYGLTSDITCSKVGGKVVLDQVAWLENRLRLFE